jgi:alkyl hydroperoxide reductase subunit F
VSGGAGFDAEFVGAAGPPLRPLDPGRRYDALVLGAGPAGLCAALYLLRKGLATGLLAQGVGGQLSRSAAVENYLGVGLVDGAALAERFRVQVAALGPDAGLDLEATAVERDGAGFLVRAGGTAYRGRAVVAATGKRPRTLGAAGEQRLAGRGVAYCAICDAPLYRDRVVGVVGGGNTGLESAIDLAKLAPRVHLFQDLDRLTGDVVLERRLREFPNVEVHLDTRVVEVLGEERVRGVRVRTGPGGAESEVALEGVFVAIGLAPNSEPFRGLLPLDQRGQIEVDAACRTAVPGLFAAGDVTNVPYKQAIVAAGEGAKAALSAADWLLRREG